ncbi:hypothetical protein ACJX0J_034896, partial [Zea mays]
MMWLTRRIYFVLVCNLFGFNNSSLLNMASLILMNGAALCQVYVVGGLVYVVAVVGSCRSKLQIDLLQVYVHELAILQKFAPMTL